MPSREVLSRHWGTDVPIVTASLIQRQAWIVITDIQRLKALHARTPKTASPCHLLHEPTFHPRFFCNTILYYMPGGVPAQEASVQENAGEHRSILKQKAD
jgi:hypothetical protein